MERMAWLFWTTRLSNRCSTPAQRSSAAYLWIRTRSNDEKKWRYYTILSLLENVCRSKTVLFEEFSDFGQNNSTVGAHQCRLPTSNTRYSTRTPTLSSENSWRILMMSVRVSLQNYFLSSLFYFLGISYSIHSHCGVLFVSHETGIFLRPAFLLAPRYHTAHKATANASALFRDPRSRFTGLFDGYLAMTSEPLKIRRQVKLGKKSFREIFQMSLTKWYVFNWNVWKNCVASVARELSPNSCRHADIYRLLRSLKSFVQIIWRTIKLSLHGILFFTHFG